MVRGACGVEGTIVFGQDTGLPFTQRLGRKKSMGFWDKVVEFFKEDDSWMQKEPRQFQGRTYTAWEEKADARAAWPNAPCAKCTGIGLKKELYWNRETDTWYHPDCMTE